jgi:hypothetical protein
MNRNNTLITIVVVAIIALIVILIVSANNKNEEGTTNVSVSQNSTPTPTSGTNPSGSALPSNTLTIITPAGGEVYDAGNTVNIAWDASQALADSTAKVVITLMQGAKEIAVLTPTGGIDADVEKFSWKVQDLSVWGEEGYSIRIVTTGLSNNLTAVSKVFSVTK